MRVLLLFCWGSLTSALAQDGAILPVELEFRDACWFDDELGSAIVYLNAEEAPSVELPYDDGEIRFYGSEIVPLNEDKRGNYAALIDFVPRKKGLSTFPSIRLKSGSQIWESSAKQILVSETRSTSEMTLEVNAAKLRVYAGEPLRLDFRWRSRFAFDQLRDLRLSPSLFSDEAVKVAVPRSVVPEDEQVGLPVASHRVIGHEKLVTDEEDLQWMEIAFSVFLKIEAIGEYRIPAVRLRCSRLLRSDVSANRYAAYFSNGLFERPDRGEAYEKLETVAEPLSIEVLPMPEKGRLESFSGLFAPVSVSVSAVPEQLEVGQLMELRVELRSDVASEMLELPPLSSQLSLRHRFWASEESTKIWRADGRSFVTRLRPLTTEVRYVPSLSFQIFDPAKGAYKMLNTSSIPLEVAKKEGRNHFSVAEISGKNQRLSLDSEGIWNNKKSNTMSELLNDVVDLMADQFLWLVLFGPILFIVLLPWAREGRRRSLDLDYMRRRRAYDQFRRAVGKQEDAVDAFTNFVAACYNVAPEAFTARDAGRLLRESGAEETLVADAQTIIRASDDGRFGKRKNASLAGMDAMAVGKRIFGLLRKSRKSSFNHRCAPI